MKRLVVFFVLLFLLTAATADAAPFRVTLMLGGLADDGGFNRLCMDGLENAKNRYTKRISVRSIQAQDAERMGGSLFDEVAAASDLVIVADSRYLDALRYAAAKFPGVKFAVIDGSGGIPNVKDVVFREEEGGFLAGVLAGLLTHRASFERINEGGAVGILIGADVPPTRRFAYGFKAGVRYADPEIRVKEAVVGDFIDAEKGRTLALAMRNEGVDVIFTAAGKAGLGAIDSAATGGYWVIGVDSEQEALAPDAVLTSVVKNSGIAVYKLIESCMQGEWNDRTLSLSVREDAIALSLWSRQSKERIPVDIRQTLDKIEEQIGLGALEIK